MEENISNDLSTIIDLLREISAKLDQKPETLLVESLPIDYVDGWDENDKGFYE